MTKNELRNMIREMLHEELAKTKHTLTEDVEGGTYVIKAWERPDQKGSVQTKFDSSKLGKKYQDFDDVLAVLNSSSELEGLGAYEITWVKSSEK